MVLVPYATPVIKPALTVATETSLLLHVPPDTELVKVVVAPAHTDVAPDIADGGVEILTTEVPRQPDDNKYDIVEVPALTPVTSPVDALIEAIDVVAELQSPPDG